MTNEEIMREAVLDEFLDELMSSKLNESSGFTSVDLRVMEAFDFTPFDALDSDNLARRYKEDLAPMHEGFGSFIGKLLMKPAVAGGGLNAAIAIIIAAVGKFLPAGGDGILGKISNFFNGTSGSATLARFGATTIPGILAAAYKVSQDPNYQQAQARHNKAVCKRMMRKAIIGAGVTGILANFIAAYLISPKATEQLAAAGDQAKEKLGDDAPVKDVAKAVGNDSASEASQDAKRAQALVNAETKGDNISVSEKATEQPVNVQNSSNDKAIDYFLDSDGEKIKINADEQEGANLVNRILNSRKDSYDSAESLMKALKKDGYSGAVMAGAEKQLRLNAINNPNDKFYAKTYNTYFDWLSKTEQEKANQLKKMGDIDYSMEKHNNAKIALQNAQSNYNDLADKQSKDALKNAAVNKKILDAAEIKADQFDKVNSERNNLRDFRDLLVSNANGVSQLSN